ncbi:hypothetical protein AMTR_s00060p00189510 [Amborella trichopoda]|uniref:Uncharacterized protein n=1 Tax=Amborella trichopoda TaxID=13333 RepID=W1NK84_AMBTC|nr:hypothetical protein AMTR_s00060p00189510 [Amborella trichopoda]
MSAAQQRVFAPEEALETRSFVLTLWKLSSQPFSMITAVKTTTGFSTWKAIEALIPHLDGLLKNGGKGMARGSRAPSKEELLCGFQAMGMNLEARSDLQQRWKNSEKKIPQSSSCEFVKCSTSCYISGA